MPPIVNAPPGKKRMTGRLEYEVAVRGAKRERKRQSSEDVRATSPGKTGCPSRGIEKFVKRAVKTTGVLLRYCVQDGGKVYEKICCVEGGTGTGGSHLSWPSGGSA